MRDGQMPAAALSLTEGISLVQTLQTVTTDHSTRPLLQKFLPLRGAGLQRLAAHDILHGGEARRKRLQVRTKSAKNTQLAAAVPELMEL